MNSYCFTQAEIDMIFSEIVQNKPTLIFKVHIFLTISRLWIVILNIVKI